MSNPQRPVSSGPARRDPLLRLLTLLGGVFGLICLSCCIGSWVVERNTVNDSINTPDETREVSRSIADIAIPAELKPWKARRTENLISSEVAAVWRAEKGSLLLLGSVSHRFDPLTTETSEVIAQVPFGGLFDATSFMFAPPIATQDVEIQGVKVSFEVRGQPAGIPVLVSTVPTPVPLIQIQGSFPRPDGSTGLIMLRVVDGEVDHVKLLNSLADPGTVASENTTGIASDVDSANMPSETAKSLDASD